MGLVQGLQEDLYTVRFDIHCHNEQSYSHRTENLSVMAP